MGLWPAAWPEEAYLIGVGGAAMSGLATLLAAKGTRVSGSDGAIYPPASEVLAAAGIEVQTPYDAANVPSSTGLVVVGNAISRGNPELEAVLDRGLPLASMSEVVERLLVPGRRVTAVGGTHGKTTTTSLLAHVHEVAGRSPSYFVGGRPGGRDTGARLGDGDDLIIEADEYDTAFFDKGPKLLHYWPRIAVLGPVEFDHADIYADRRAVERAFELFLRLVPSNGTVVVHADDETALRIASAARSRLVRVGLGEGCEFRARERVDDGDGQDFEVVVAGASVGRARLPLPGAHNARNALAAVAAATAAGVDPAEAVAALASFEPPRRRLQKIASGSRGTVYDDFAHHPTAVAQTLRTLRPLVPEGGRLIACLEPRSNTMVRALVADELEDALSLADVVLIGPVDRPDRFEPHERLDVAALAERVRARGREAEGPLGAEEIVARLDGTTRPEDRIVIMSNGAFGGLPRRLGEALADGGAR